MCSYRETRIKLTPGFEIKVLEATGWGWSGNENAYGLVIWPGAKSVAKYLAENTFLVGKGKRVVEIGAGSALCSLVCAALGSTVLATDLNLEPLKLAQAAAKQQGLELKTCIFDLLGQNPIPNCDVLVLADCIYTPELGRAAARRAIQAKNFGATVIVGSAANRPGNSAFREELQKEGYVVNKPIRSIDFSSPLSFLDYLRGNYVQEITVL